LALAELTGDVLQQVGEGGSGGYERDLKGI
jgi:hypothetical protein